MVYSFKTSSGTDILFNPTCMTAEKVVDAETNEVTGYVVIKHYLDECDNPQQETYQISEQAYTTLTSKS